VLSRLAKRGNRQCGPALPDCGISVFPPAHWSDSFRAQTPQPDPKKVQTVWLFEAMRQASMTIFGAALPARPTIWSRTRAAMSR
jgi:hypothetical protein